MKKAESKWWSRLLKKEGKPPVFLKVDWNKWVDEDGDEDEKRKFIYSRSHCSFPNKNRKNAVISSFTISLLMPFYLFQLASTWIPETLIFRLVASYACFLI